MPRTDRGVRASVRMANKKRKLRARRTAKPARAKPASASQPPAKPPPRVLPAAPSEERLGFPVVGLGASAGGLDALGEFFEHVPPASGVAFVVVTHQHPGHVSLLPELLARRTSLAVGEILDGAKVESDHVYVAPPGKNVALLGGVLHLMNQEPTAGLHLPVDYFFRALAPARSARWSSSRPTTCSRILRSPSSTSCSAATC